MGIAELIHKILQQIVIPNVDALKKVLKHLPKTTPFSYYNNTPFLYLKFLATDEIYDRVNFENLTEWEIKTSLKA